jgi:hypothetical protein
MTTPRQPLKSRQRAVFRALAMLLALAAAGLPPVAASPGKPVVVDPQTGIAISGFDPVAYFTDATPSLGTPELELSIAGAVWRFRSDGNRAAFADNPEVYAPQFGGYDPVAIARGASVPGHPLYWLVTGQHLYLFYSAQARTAFLADSSRILDAAERKWPAVQATLP